MKSDFRLCVLFVSCCYLFYRLSTQNPAVIGSISQDAWPENQHVFHHNATQRGRKNLKKYKITIHADGRLGNHLFMVAALQGIAKRNQLTFVFPGALRHVLDFFKMKTEMRKILSHSGPGYPYTDFFSDNSLSFDPRTQDILEHVPPEKSVLLKGYYQSFKYFENIEKDIRAQYQFKDSIKKTVRKFLKESSPRHDKQVTYIGIHIRRGDFLNPQFQTRGMVAVNETYIAKAKSYMREHYENVVFVVTGDDKEWITDHVMDKATILSPFTQPEMDLALLAGCDHIIISTGTFSWWAGWLNKGHTVYYSQYPKPGSDLARGFVRENYYPSEWIPLS